MILKKPLGIWIILACLLVASGRVFWWLVTEYFDPMTRHFPTIWETGVAYRYLGAATLATTSALGLYFRQSWARIGVVIILGLVVADGFWELYQLHKYSRDIFERAVTTPRGWFFIFLTILLPVLATFAAIRYLYGPRTRLYFQK